MLRGEELTGLPPHSITRRGMSYVPQLDNVFQSLTVEENLEMGALEMGTAKERMQVMYEIFPRLGERRTQDAGTMSGGERQMLAMGAGADARAAACCCWTSPRPGWRRPSSRRSSRRSRRSTRPG